MKNEMICHDEALGERFNWTTMLLELTLTGKARDDSQVEREFALLCVQSEMKGDDAALDFEL